MVDLRRARILRFLTHRSMATPENHNCTLTKLPNYRFYFGNKETVSVCLFVRLSVCNKTPAPPNSLRCQTPPKHPDWRKHFFYFYFFYFLSKMNPNKPTNQQTDKKTPTKVSSHPGGMTQEANTTQANEMTGGHEWKINEQLVLNLNRFFCLFWDCFFFMVKNRTAKKKKKISQVHKQVNKGAFEHLFFNFSQLRAPRVSTFSFMGEVLSVNFANC